jgi:hypothetical protein
LEDQRVPGYIEGYVRRFWQVRAGQQAGFESRTEN